VDPADVWDHSGNADLRERRAEGTLLPGDLVTIPTPMERPSFAVSAGNSYRFTAMVPLHDLHLALTEGGEAQANTRYTAECDGVRHEGTTDGSGHVTIPVRPSTRFVTLTLHHEAGEGEDEGHDEVLRIEVGGLDPGDELTGIQARLRNLGHSPGPIDGEMGPRTRRAIETFQRDEGLQVTGELDDETMQRLDDRHGD
jgi:hypothetical protein